MMLAHRVQLDVAHHDHVVVFFLEDAFANDFLGSVVVALSQEPH
jgi:hypothetical protein